MGIKYRVLLVSVTLMLVCSIFLGTSYSLWKTSFEQQGTNEINIGCFTVTYTNVTSYGGNEAGDINLSNSYPITETAGSAQTPYMFKIKNTCDTPADYVVNIETLNTSTFNTDYLRVKFNEASVTNNTSVLYSNLTNTTAALANSLSAKQLATGYLEENEEITYALRTWIDIEATTETPNVMGETWSGKIVVTSEATDAIPLPYEIISGDLDTVGSVVKIADEEFYVIGQEDASHVKLLSKWNLNVGSNTKGTATGLQDSDVKGYVSGGTTYGNVAFSSTNYWCDGSALKSEYGSSHPAYVYDSNASIKTYVDNYVTYLNNQGVSVTGRLINQDELVSLGCNESTEYCDSNGAHDGTAPEWVYQTSYWSGSTYDNYNLWITRSSGYFGSDNDGDEYDFGVRPVIILEK